MTRVLLLLVLVAASKQPPQERGGTFFSRLTRETNSYAATRRGTADFQQKKYAEAKESFATAQRLVPNADHAFNLGTALVAAGEREEGAATLTQATKEPRLRADALYNRGSGALAASAYDHAIRDLSHVLRLRPNDGKAKRNLEIALLRKSAMERRTAKQQSRQGQQPNQQQAPAQSQGEQEAQKPQQQMNAEELLRSVQQQEREELQRMRRGRAESKRVGW